MTGSGNPHNAVRHFAAGLIPGALVLLLAGCGFQLRGSPPVPAALQPLYVSCSEEIPIELCERVKTQLDQGGIELAKADAAAYRLQLNRFDEKRRASAISLDASAAEYDVRQTVSMSIVSADKIPVLADAEVRASDTYRYDDTNVLAKRREEKTLRDQLYTRLAQQVIFRMAPYSSKHLMQIRQHYRDEQASKEDTEKKPATGNHQPQENSP